MKSILAFVLYLFSLTNIYSQKFDGYVVTTANDTINCKFFVQTNLFDKTFFYPNLPEKNRIKILNDNGEKVVFNTNQLKSFLIKGTNRGDYKFVSVKDDPKRFYHEVVKGKISILVFYKPNLRGGFPFGIKYFLKENKLYKLNDFSRRKTVGNLIIDYLDLYNKWMDSNNYYKIDQIDYVIELYNEYFKTKIN